MFSFFFDALFFAFAGCLTAGSESSDTRLVNVQSHGEKLMRRHLEVSDEHIELLASGHMVAERELRAARTGAHDHTVRDTLSTLTTTLSRISSTAAAGLDAPPSRRIESPGTSPSLMALMRTSPAPLMRTSPVPTAHSPVVDTHMSGSELVARQSVTDARQRKQSPNGTQNAIDVPNDMAAFNVSGAGVLRFNGIYMPSALSWNGGCTEFVWDMLNGNALHLLYSKKVDGVDVWCLQERGKEIMYQGPAQPGQCAPEFTSWAAMTTAAGTVPLVTRRAASDFTMRTTSTEAPGFTTVGMKQSYFIVDGAGIVGFNGIYYTTEQFAINQRCERIYAKGAPDNDEYTLRYGHPMWYFESRINGQVQRPFFGQDFGDCSPENVQWLSTFAGIATPTVVESLTATTTTATTTTVTQACPTGYISYFGDIAGWDEFGRGNQNQLSNIDACGEDCTQRKDCLSFGYSSTTRICKLKKAALPTANQNADYKFCSKANAAEEATYAAAAAESPLPGTVTTTTTTTTTTLVEGGASSIFSKVWLRAGILLPTMFALANLGES